MRSVPAFSASSFVLLRRLLAVFALATLAACSPPPAQSMQALAWPRLLERLALWQVLGLRA